MLGGRAPSTAVRPYTMQLSLTITLQFALPGALHCRVMVCSYGDCARHPASFQAAPGISDTSVPPSERRYHSPGPPEPLSRKGVVNCGPL